MNTTTEAKPIHIPFNPTPTDSYTTIAPLLGDVLTKIGYPADEQVLESYRNELPRLAIQIADHIFSMGPQWKYANAMRLMKMMDEQTRNVVLERIYQYKEKDNHQVNTLENFDYKEYGEKPWAAHDED